MAETVVPPGHRSSRARHGCQRLQQPSTHGEVLIAEQRLVFPYAHQLLQEEPHDLLVHQPLPVSGERGRVPDRIIRAQPHNPAE